LILIFLLQRWRWTFLAAELLVKAWFSNPSLFLLSCFPSAYLIFLLECLKPEENFLLGEFEFSFESIQGSLLLQFCFLCGVLAFCVLRVESGGRFQTCHLPFGIIQESELGIWRGFRFLWSWLSLGFGGWTEQRKGYVFLLLNLSSIDCKGFDICCFWWGWFVLWLYHCE